MEQAIKYKISEEFNQGCAAISFNYSSENDDELSILMYFADMIGGTKYNLEIKFNSIVAIQYEKEMPGLLSIPDAPHCSKKYFTEFIHPILMIKDSEWVRKYENYVSSLTHYVFISMNDIVHVLTEEKPEMKHILSDRTGESYNEKLKSLCTQVINKKILFIDAIYEIVNFGSLSNTSELKILNDIYNDILHLPLGEQKKLWNAKVLKDKESEIMMYEKEARKKALHICEKLISEIV